MVLVCDRLCNALRVRVLVGQTKLRKEGCCLERWGRKSGVDGRGSMPSSEIQNHAERQNNGDIPHSASFHGLTPRGSLIDG